jgi:hypothetical protein
MATEARVALERYANRRSTIMSEATTFGADMRLVQEDEIDAVSGGLLPAIAIGIGLGALFGVGLVIGDQLWEHQHRGSIMRGIVRGLPRT